MGKSVRVSTWITVLGMIITIITCYSIKGYIYADSTKITDPNNDLTIKAYFGNDRLKYGAVSLDQKLPFYIRIQAKDNNKFMSMLPDIYISNTINIYSINGNSDYSGNKSTIFGPDCIATDTDDPNITSQIIFTGSTATCSPLEPPDSNYMPLTIPVFSPNINEDNVRIIYQGQNIQTLASARTPTPTPFIYELDPNIQEFDPNVWGTSGNFNIDTVISDSNNYYYKISGSPYTANANTQDMINTVTYTINNLLADNLLPTEFNRNYTGTIIPDQYLLDPNQDYVLIFEYQVAYNGNPVGDWRKVAIPILNIVNSSDEYTAYNIENFNIDDYPRSYIKPRSKRVIAP